MDNNDICAFIKADSIQVDGKQLLTKYNKDTVIHYGLLNQMDKLYILMIYPIIMMNLIVLYAVGIHNDVINHV